MQNDKSKFKKEFIQRLIRYSIRTIKICNELRKDRNLYSVADQLIRSATSIGANVIEAKSSSSRKDYIRYFEIALKSANETKFWLIVIKECYPQSQEEIQNLLNETDELAKIIGSSVLTLKGKK